MGGSRGRLSNTPGGEESRAEEEEEEPTPGKDLAETAGSTAARDPDPEPDRRATEAATGVGALEPLEAQTGAMAGPGERPTVETLLLFFVLSFFLVNAPFLINDLSYIMLI